ncbi:hypothetical protein R5R35_006092 [Gryllus longicercus]|uniref:Uncharacterized protein n=1 Tax=Gryllus longicercus TaxID=2509291 RepID=A0AAN9VW46_9ORTH
MVMHLKSCCCGCSLKTGTVIIGVLSGIGALCGLIMSILGASVGTGELQKEFLKELEKQKGITLDQAEYEEAVKHLEATSGNKTLSALFICLAIVYGIHLIFDILMVFGASAERPRMIKPWIVFAIMALVVQSILSFVNIIFHFTSGAAMVGVLGLVMLAVGIALAVYFILVVNSFHTELLSNNFQNKI